MNLNTTDLNRCWSLTYKWIRVMVIRSWTDIIILNLKTISKEICGNLFSWSGSIYNTMIRCMLSAFTTHKDDTFDERKKISPPYRRHDLSHERNINEISQRSELLTADIRKQHSNIVYIERVTLISLYKGTANRVTKHPNFTRRENERW